MIIAVDFDGTIQVKDPKGHKVPNIPLIQSLIGAQMAGNIVILWTCRSGKRLNEAISYCLKHGFRPNFVNQNAPEAIRMLGCDTRKIYVDIYIDDKSRR
jgi:hypothetical protein